MILYINKDNILCTQCPTCGEVSVDGETVTVAGQVLCVFHHWEVLGYTHDIEKYKKIQSLISGFVRWDFETNSKEILAKVYKEMEGV